MVPEERRCLGVLRLKLGEVMFDSAVVAVSEKKFKTALCLLEDVVQFGVEMARSLLVSVGHPDDDHLRFLIVDPDLGVLCQWIMS